MNCGFEIIDVHSDTDDALEDDICAGKFAAHRSFGLVGWLELWLEIELCRCWAITIHRRPVLPTESDELLVAIGAVLHWDRDSLLFTDTFIVSVWSFNDDVGGDDGDDDDDVNWFKIEFGFGMTSWLRIVDDTVLRVTAFERSSFFRSPFTNADLLSMFPITTESTAAVTTVTSPFPFVFFGSDSPPTLCMRVYLVGNWLISVRLE